MLKHQSNRKQLALLLPILLPVILISVFPLLRGMFLGFTDYRLGDEIRFNGLENYVQLFQDSFFWQSFKVGIVWTVVVTAGQILLGLGLALLLNTRIRFGSIYAILMLVPWAMPPIIRGIVWRQLFDLDTGAVNILFTGLGIIGKPINWLSSFEYAVPAVIVAGIWGEVPKAAVFLLAGLQAIPNSLYEAARIDGANAFKELIHITIPSLKTILAAIVSLSFMWNFNTFGIVWVLTQGGPGGLTRLPMLAAYEEAFRYGYVGYAAAIGNVMVVIISLILFTYLRIELKERLASATR